MSVGMISEQKGNIRKYPFDKTEIEIGNNKYKKLFLWNWYYKY